MLMMSLKPDFPPVRACIFDMDGLLIDSEDIYTDITNRILAEYGRPALPWSIKAQLQGRPGPAAEEIFQAWAQLPITVTEQHAKVAVLQRELFPNAQPLPGVPNLLANLSTSPSHVHLALATSSHAANFALKTAHLQPLFSVFAAKQIVKGDDLRIGKGRGKPAPDIYLLALETINHGLREKGEKEVRVEECVVFEDSVPGVEAGRRAGMRVVWCPHPELLKEFKGREAEVLAGATGAMGLDERGVGKQLSGEDMLQGWPGKLGDGWADLLLTLEGFPYERYGIGVKHEERL